MNDGIVIRDVMAQGLSGIWRLEQFDFTATVDDVAKRVPEDLVFLQPEENGRFVLLQFDVGEFLLKFIPVE